MRKSADPIASLRRRVDVLCKNYNYNIHLVVRKVMESENCVLTLETLKVTNELFLNP